MSSLIIEDILACEGQLLTIDTETNGLLWWEDNKMIGLGIFCPTAYGGKGVQSYAHTCHFEELPFGKAKTKKEFLGTMDYTKSKRGRKVQETVVYQPMVMTAIPNDARIKIFVDAVRKIAMNPATTLVGHNIKFDLHMMGLKSWELPCKIVDTSVMVHLYDSRLLKALAAAEEYFLGKSSKRRHVSKAEKRFSKAPWRWDSKVLEDYCVNDCVVTHQLFEVLKEQLEKLDLLGLLAKEMRYLRLLQKMEEHGILVTTIFCHEAIKEFDKNQIALEKDLYDAVGHEFNWRSNAELSQAIYDDLGIPKPENPYAEDEYFNRTHHAIAKMYTKTATGTPLLVRESHPLASIILPLRETVKLKEYAEKYIRLRDHKGMIHASFNQAKTLTGRLSSSEPNLQNLPSEKRKTGIESTYTGGAIRVGGYNLRQALVPRFGYKMVSIDHKQQEMRLLAILADEPVMLEAMRLREDIHLRVAIRVWGDCGEALNKIHRDWSKAISFGLIYGLSEQSLQEYFTKVGVEANAGVVKEQYFDAFPGLRPWFQEVIQYVRAYGHVQYWSKRYWYADDPGEGYKGINALIQGGCADFMSVVAMRVDKILTKQGWGYVLSIIHDEILLEVKEEYLDLACPVLARAMEGEDIFDIPFATDLEVGDSYGGLGGFPLMRDPSTIDWKEYV